MKKKCPEKWSNLMSGIFSCPKNWTNSGHEKNPRKIFRTYSGHTKNLDKFWTNKLDKFWTWKIPEIFSRHILDMKKFWTNSEQIKLDIFQTWKYSGQILDMKDSRRQGKILDIFQTIFLKKCKLCKTDIYNLSCHTN